MRRFLILTISFVLSVGFIFGQEQERHQMNNSFVSINAVDFRNSRNIERVKENGRDFITAKNPKLTQPYAEYGIKSKMAGGVFKVTITYKISKEELKNKNSRKIVKIALDEHKAEEIELKENNSGYLRASSEFDIKFLRGKNHVLKLWLPSKGVLIDKIEIRRKLI